MLSEKEIDILIEAMNAWKYKDDIDHFSKSLISGLMYPKGSPEFDKESRRLEKERLEYEKVVKLRQETATLIQAKLIQAKQDMAIDRLFSE